VGEDLMRITITTKREGGSLKTAAAMLGTGCEELAHNTADFMTREAQIMAPILKNREMYQNRSDPPIPEFLKWSIKPMSLGKLKWKVIVGADYGFYVEYGTRYMAAQPFFRPAAGSAHAFMLIQAKLMLKAVCKS
jgi:HK97 gp10 family phage protein